MRLLSLLLLLELAARFGLDLARNGYAVAPAISMPAALGLGGCLWWVAQRQIGQAGAGLLLLFYVSSPAALHPGPALVAALGLFAMLYTAVGVAHAMQGPGRKRPPRIALMAALTAFTAAAAALAAWVGLLLGALAALYLAEGRRRVLLPLFLLWGAVAEAAAHVPLPLGRAAPAVFLPAPAELAVAAALLFWASARRTRFFGNSAPLLAAVLLLASSPWAGPQARVWALPLILLFLAGVAADAAETRRGQIWMAFFWGFGAVQLVRTFAAPGA